MVNHTHVPKSASKMEHEDANRRLCIRKKVTCKYCGKLRSRSHEASHVVEYKCILCPDFATRSRSTLYLHQHKHHQGDSAFTLKVSTDPVPITAPSVNEPDIQPVVAESSTEAKAGGEQLVTTKAGSGKRTRVVAEAEAIWIGDEPVTRSGRPFRQFESPKRDGPPLTKIRRLETVPAKPVPTSTIPYKTTSNPVARKPIPQIVPYKGSPPSHSQQPPGTWHPPPDEPMLTTGQMETTEEELTDWLGALMMESGIPTSDSEPDANLVIPEMSPQSSVTPQAEQMEDDTYHQLFQDWDFSHMMM